MRVYFTPPSAGHVPSLRLEHMILEACCQINFGWPEHSCYNIETYTISMSEFHNDSIFWVELDRIKPNPYQPRREFNEAKLSDLADSIRQYGVLQPLVVTRRELQTDDGGLAAEYELIAGERRLRASRIAGLSQIPVIIRSSEESDQMKLELAIIENLQREDLNPVDRASAFRRLVDEFSFKHFEIAKKIGKSREYVSNSLRILTLPDDIQSALAIGTVSEGHARSVMMLNDRPEEQQVLFKEIIDKKLTVRESESIARRIAYDKIRKKNIDPELIELEKQFTESFGTRVQIEHRDVGKGKLVIDFFSPDDLRHILALFDKIGYQHLTDKSVPTTEGEVSTQVQSEDENIVISEEQPGSEEGDLYSIKNFSV